MGNIPLHAKAVPRLDVGAQTSNSSISDPSDLSPRDVELTALPPQAAPREHPPQTENAVVGIFWDYENVRVPRWNLTLLIAFTRRAGPRKEPKLTRRRKCSERRATPRFGMGLSRSGASIA